ncbi:hypothetical protein OPQ81_011781 [Rhizoctonia solani]|nr:hypothetical protein OPQ81_011781 [Rhizoctonia solani]
MANSPGSGSGPELAIIAHRLVAGKYFMLASFIFMVYDHVITLGEEVDRIWRQEWTGATWLFALNRYLTELQFIVNLVSFHNPHWTGKVRRFYSLSWGLDLDLYRNCRDYHDPQNLRNKYILGLLVFFWTVQIIVMGTTMRHATRVVLPEGLVGCIQGGNGRYAAAFWFAPVTTDTLIFGLTVFKSLEYIYKTRYRVPLVRVILRDGILHFTVILCANLLNCLLYYLAPGSLKVIGASFSQIITVVMISRLQLNLRSESVCSIPGMPTSQLPPVSSSEFGEKDKQGSGTISTLSHYFDTTVTDLGKEMLVACGETRENKQIIRKKAREEIGAANCPCGVSKCLCRIFGGEPPVELEMRPIRSVSGEFTMLDTHFTPEETAYLDRAIQISPAVVEEWRPSV